MTISALSDVEIDHLTGNDHDVEIMSYSRIIHAIISEKWTQTFLTIPAQLIVKQTSFTVTSEM